MLAALALVVFGACDSCPFKFRVKPKNRRNLSIQKTLDSTSREPKVHFSRLSHNILSKLNKIHSNPGFFEKYARVGQLLQNHYTFQTIRFIKQKLVLNAPEISEKFKRGKYRWQTDGDDCRKLQLRLSSRFATPPAAFSTL